jgi:hypothetical protein
MALSWVDYRSQSLSKPEHSSVITFAPSLSRYERIRDLDQIQVRDFHQ